MRSVLKVVCKCMMRQHRQVIDLREYAMVSKGSQVWRGDPAASEENCKSNPPQ